ncbi:MAG: hypothetical protein IPP96_08745 [Chitinophagaceae bacterium]|nr:hypothetical protein [Chitinophagaceae bacterium]
MEHVYTVHTKLIEGKTYYFVKKIMTFPELGEAANLVTGYGMHTDFEKACNIAGIEDTSARKKLLAEIEHLNKPKEPAKKPSVQITESVNKWLAEIGVAVLN